jgi:hypothetical protein
MSRNPKLPMPVKAIVRIINIGLAPFGKKLNVFISNI